MNLNIISVHFHKFFYFFFFFLMNNSIFLLLLLCSFVSNEIDRQLTFNVKTVKIVSRVLYEYFVYIFAELNGVCN